VATIQPPNADISSFFRAPLQRAMLKTYWTPYIIIIILPNSDAHHDKPAILIPHSRLDVLQARKFEQYSALAPCDNTLKMIFIYGEVNTIDYLQRHRILHRDLTASNILVKEIPECGV
jgi:serine/threonine protein kinase